MAVGTDAVASAALDVGMVDVMVEVMAIRGEGDRGAPVARSGEVDIESAC